MNDLRDFNEHQNIRCYYANLWQGTKLSDEEADNITDVWKRRGNTQMELYSCPNLIETFYNLS